MEIEKRMPAATSRLKDLRTSDLTDLIALCDKALVLEVPKYSDFQGGKAKAIAEVKTDIPILREGMKVKVACKTYSARIVKPGVEKSLVKKLEDNSENLVPNFRLIRKNKS